MTLAIFACVTGMTCYYALIQPPPPPSTTASVTPEPTLLLGPSIQLFELQGCVETYDGNLEDTLTTIQDATRPSTTGYACVPGTPLTFSFAEASPGLLAKRSALNFPTNTFRVDYSYNATVPTLTQFSGDLDDTLGET